MIKPKYSFFFSKIASSDTDYYNEVDTLTVKWGCYIKRNINVKNLKGVLVQIIETLSDVQ